MGKEAEIRAEVNDATGEVRALLERDELILRGDIRIPEQVCELLGLRAELEIGCAAGGDVNGVAAVDGAPTRREFRRE